MIKYKYIFIMKRISFTIIKVLLIMIKVIIFILRFKSFIAVVGIININK